MMNLSLVERISEIFCFFSVELGFSIWSFLIGSEDVTWHAVVCLQSAGIFFRLGEFGARLGHVRFCKDFNEGLLELIRLELLFEPPILDSWRSLDSGIAGLFFGTPRSVLEVLNEEIVSLLSLNWFRFSSAVFAGLDGLLRRVDSVLSWEESLSVDLSLESTEWASNESVLVASAVWDKSSVDRESGVPPREWNVRRIEALFPFFMLSTSISLMAAAEMKPPSPPSAEEI